MKLRLSFLKSSIYVFLFIIVTGSNYSGTIAENDLYNTGTISRGANSQMYGSMTLSDFYNLGTNGYGPIQAHPSWCVFACIGFFGNGPQCNLASFYVEEYYPGVDCCGQGPDLMSFPSFDEYYEEWAKYTLCFDGVSSDRFADFATRIDKPVAYVEPSSILVMFNYIRWEDAFPCYGIIDNGDGSGHCVILTGLYRSNYSGQMRYELYFWNPKYGRMEYSTKYDYGSFDRGEIYFYSRSKFK